MLTPDQALKKSKEIKEKAAWIPAVVFEAFDELILKTIDEDGYAKFTVKEVVKVIRSKKGAPRKDTLFNNKMLDVEDFYRKAGWKVTFDKAHYTENYDDFFVFEKKS